LVPFDKTRIERAIERACESLGMKELSFIDDVSSDIVETLKNMIAASDNEKVLTIEEIQDVVENKLMEF
jgi:hypothetical protein